MMGREKGYAPGKQLYYDLVDGGYKTVEIDTSKMSRFITHLAHATEPVVLKNPAKRRRTERKFQRRLNKVWQEKAIQEPLTDDSLDN